MTPMMMGMEEDEKQKKSVEPNYHPCFNFWFYILIIVSGFLTGYQTGIVAGSELFINDEYKDVPQAADTR